MKAYTDYPFTLLGDEPCKEAPIREIEVLSYDGNKYCKIIVNGVHEEIKSGYIYNEKGRFGEVKSITKKQLESLLTSSPSFRSGIPTVFKLQKQRDSLRRVL